MNTFVDAPVVYSKVYNIYKTIMFIVFISYCLIVLYCIHFWGLLNTVRYTILRPPAKGLGVGLPTIHPMPCLVLYHACIGLGWGMMHTHTPPAVAQARGDGSWKLVRGAPHISLPPKKI